MSTKPLLVIVSLSRDKAPDRTIELYETKHISKCIQNNGVSLTLKLYGTSTAGLDLMIEPQNLQYETIQPLEEGQYLKCIGM